MVRSILIFACACLLVCCSNPATNELGADVKIEFLKTMEGSYAAKAPFPAEQGAPDNELHITAEGNYEFRQYWHLAYPLETCTLAGNEIRCSTEMLDTYCRLIDSGKIVKVIEFPENPNTEGLVPTHEVRGLRFSSQYDSSSPYTIDGAAVPSAETACLEMAKTKNLKSGMQFSRFSVVWPDPQTLHFNHVTIPVESGLSGLDVTGTFSKVIEDGE